MRRPSNWDRRNKLGVIKGWLLFEWSLLDEFDAFDAALRVPADPNVWTVGGLVLDKVSGASYSGSGFYVHLPSQA